MDKKPQRGQVWSFMGKPVLVWKNDGKFVHFYRDPVHSNMAAKVEWFLEKATDTGLSCVPAGDRWEDLDRALSEALKTQSVG
jgi:hypothetical protein